MGLSPDPCSQSITALTLSLWKGAAPGGRNLPVEQAFTPRAAGRRMMNLQRLYTALLTADLAAAEAWCTKLLGRGPDNRPMPSLVQWELFDRGGLGLSDDDEIAGSGAIWTSRPSGGDFQGDYSTLAQLRDLDGNLITLASPPSRSFPAA